MPGSDKITNYLSQGCLLLLLSRVSRVRLCALQCSCLENPRDRGAWWAVVYGVRGLEGVPGLPGAPQDEAGLTRKFETSHVGGPEDFPNPGIEATSLMSPALAGGFFTTSTTQGTPLGDGS